MLYIKEDLPFGRSFKFLFSEIYLVKNFRPPMNESLIIMRIARTKINCDANKLNIFEV